MNNLCQCPFPYCNDIASIQFLNKDKISCNCLRNHNTTKEVNDIRKHYSKKIDDNKNDNKYSFCNEHNSEFLYFCQLCKINFCYYCKNKHDKHRYICLLDKIPCNDIINNLKKYINSQKKEIENINNLFNELIQNLKNQFHIMFNSLYNYLLCEETILNFSLNNINNINSIKNIKYIFNLNFIKLFF